MEYIIAKEFKGIPIGTVLPEENLFLQYMGKPLIAVYSQNAFLHVSPNDGHHAERKELVDGIRHELNRIASEYVPPVKEIEEGLEGEEEPIEVEDDPNNTPMKARAVLEENGLLDNGRIHRSFYYGKITKLRKAYAELKKI